MKEYCTNLRIKISELDSVIPKTENCPEVFHAHLRIEPKKDVILKIFFQDNLHLDSKVDHWLHRQNKYEKLGDVFEVTSINNQANLVDIDFSESNLKSLQTSSNFYEGKEKYFLIGLDSVRLVFKPVENTENNSGWFTSEFYLTPDSQKLIEDNYWYQGFVGDSSVWKANNRENDYIRFNDVEVQFDYKFYSKKNDERNNYEIFKEPRLKIRHRNLSEKSLIGNASLICDLLSFYRHGKVEFEFARIHMQQNTVTITRVCEQTTLSFPAGFHRIGYGESFIKFLTDINIEKLNPHIEIFSKLVESKNLSMLLIGESKFMVLYNIIEQVRNIYSNKGDVQQEYKFTETNNKTDKFIRRKLKEIVEVVVEEQKSEFLERVIGHTRAIKFLPMANQFDNLFEYFQLSINDYGIDFGELMKMRNEVFHGHPIDRNDKQLKNANEVLPTLTSILLLKMIGINL